MSNQPRERLELISDGGIASQHEAVETQTVLVGPTTADEHNTIKAGISAIACWRVEDFRFEFDSSVVRPELEFELANLARLLQELPPDSKSSQKPGFPLTVFGHADPTGNDDYNKQLSGRRATAIYGLLTRDSALWEKLFSSPLGNDKWGANALELMLDTVSPDRRGRQNHEDALQHQRSAGKRKQLFEQYMDSLCGPELKLEKGDFLGRGEDPGGKADFQGCGEFNPVLLFSERDQRKFDAAADKDARNAANAPNRRVLVLIFRKGTRVVPSRWPCPKASDGVAGCRRRFWSDGNERRTKRLPDDARKFEKTADTFGCRFYQRLAATSPCEGGFRLWVIRLLEAGPGPIDQRRPLANLPFSVTGVGGTIPEIRGTTDARGVIRIVVKSDPATMILTIAGQELTVLAGSLKPIDEGPEAIVQRLQNLGFGLFERGGEAAVGLIAGLESFQRLHDLPLQAEPDEALRGKLKQLHGS